MITDANTLQILSGVAVMAMIVFAMAYAAWNN